MCPSVHPVTRRLRDRPEALARYPESLLSLCDFERDRVVFQTPNRTASGDMALGQMAAFGDGYDAAQFEPLRMGFRTADLIAQMRELGARWFLANMRDAVPYGPQVYFGHDANIIQYNRRIGDRTGVLWRLPQYFEPTPNLGYVPERRSHADEVAFADKRPMIVWRGNRTGRQWLTPHSYRQFHGGHSAETLAREGGWNSRGLAVLRSLAEPDLLNCRFAITPRQARRAPGVGPTEIEDHFRTHSWLLRFRYQLCLPGNDVSTQLYWMLNTNSLVMKVDADYEVIPDFFLEPWVHYVPVAADLSDLRDKFDYCEANPDLCRAIIERAQAAHARILDAAAWHEAELKVLDKLGVLA